MTEAISSAAFFLPWPDRRLNPNAREHWAIIASAKKKAKNQAYYLALEAGLGKINADALSVRYVFYPPSRREFDLDNALSSLKAAADGIALAVGIDDSKWAVAVSKAGAIEKGGMVKVELEWAA